MDPTRIDALMTVALDEARAALEHGDVPIGAVVARLDTGEVVARRHNERELQADPTAHAEVLALRDAAADARPVAARRVRARRHARTVPDVRRRGAQRAHRRWSRSVPRIRRPARSGASTTSPSIPG